MKALARVAERFMDNKDLIIRAVDEYEAFTPSYRKILKLLIDISVDDITQLSVLQISKISNLSRQLVYEALGVMEQEKLIEIEKKNRGKISGVILKPNKLNEIVKHYNARLVVIKKYRKDV